MITAKQEKLISALEKTVHDPLGFVRWAYGVEPNKEQSKILSSIKEPFQVECSDPDVLIWVASWYVSTRPHCGVGISSGFDVEPLWARLKLWHGRSMHKKLFLFDDRSFFFDPYQWTWFAYKIVYDPDRPEQFAGYFGPTLFVFDDALKIDPIVFEICSHANIIKSL